MSVTWIKHKYTQTRTAGRYRSSSNDSGTKGKTKRKASDAERAAIHARQPRVTLVLLPSGKRRFVHEPPTPR